MGILGGNSVKWFLEPSYSGPRKEKALCGGAALGSAREAARDFRE